MGRRSTAASTTVERGENRGRPIGVGAGCAVLIALAGCAAPAAPIDDAAPQSHAEYAEAYADWLPRYIDCARSFGANAEALPDGAIQSPVAPGREAVYGLDAECVEQVGEPPAAAPLTDAFLVGLYELLVEQADCLRAAGYEISEPPSRVEWVENYGGGSWAPLVDVMESDRDAADANRVCPQPDPVEAERIGIEQSEQG